MAYIDKEKLKSMTVQRNRIWDSITDSQGRGLSEIIDSIPTADVQEVKHGKWTEKHHSYSDEEYVIEEWQSCRCSECGRYDTRPYMYYFIEPKFCSYCGAKMDGKETVNEKD